MYLGGRIKRIERITDTKSMFLLAVDRLSDTTDLLPVKIDAYKLSTFRVGDSVTIKGKVNSKNVNRDHRSVQVFAYAETIRKNDVSKNIFRASGKLCRIQPLYQASKNRVLVECILAVSRGSRRDYIPLVCWGNVAETVNTYDIDTYVSVEGRFQSRTYKNGNRAHTVYEISVTTMKEREKCLA